MAIYNTIHNLGFLRIERFMAIRVRKANMHHLTKFHQNRSNCFWNIIIFQFFKMVAAEALLADGVQRVTISNFIKTSQSIAIFRIIKMAAIQHLELF